MTDMRTGTGGAGWPASMDGRTVVVTGASSGIGRHFARVLARHGADVVVVARRADRLAGLVDEIHARGERASAVAGDLATHDSARAVFDRILGERREVHALVNNAGFGLVRKAFEHTDDDWDQTMAVNLTAPWELSRCFARHRADVGTGGAILNVASAAALAPMPDTAAYATSKAALVHLTKILAREWGPMGVRVNCLCPGHFPTELNAEFLDDADMRARVARKIPLGRLGDLSDLDSMLLLLISDDAAYVTGAVVPVDGGHSLTSS